MALPQRGGVCIFVGLRVATQVLWRGPTSRVCLARHVSNPTAGNVCWRHIAHSGIDYENSTQNRNAWYIRIVCDVHSIPGGIVFRKITARTKAVLCLPEESDITESHGRQ